MSIVVCILPRAGLGNQLFPLTKAMVFAELNKLPLTIINYNQIKIGPYLRGEKAKRSYGNFFCFEKNIIGQQLDKWKLKRFRNYREIKEPPVEIIKDSDKEKKLYLFSVIPHWSNYFEGLKENRQLAIDLLYKQISSRILEALNSHKPPEIGVHIRMGDFRKLKVGEDFSKVGAVRTPGDYFINVTNSIREINGKRLPVTIFSDGYRSELAGILKLDNISLQEGNSDLLDMLLLSKSKIIVTSAGSTFSYWAGFLSQAPVIKHPDHIHQSIRPEEMGKIFYEGVFDRTNSLLKESIRRIV